MAGSTCCSQTAISLIVIGGDVMLTLNQVGTAEEQINDVRHGPSR